MNVFISGGCKNGKSMFAQKEARRIAKAKGVPLYYLATMIPKDDEDRARVIRHCKEREGWGFDTIEQGREICKCLERVNTKGVFLLDSVTALLENEMFRSDGTIDYEAGDRVAKDLKEFAKRTGNTVFVSDFIYCDALEFFDLTEKYMEALAKADKSLAKICERVIEVSFGNTYEYKEVK